MGLPTMPADVRTILRILSQVRLCASYGAVLALMASAVPAQVPGPQFTMDSVNVRQEGVVSFSTLFAGPDPRSDFPEPRFLVGQTDDQAFRLYVDVDSIQQVRFNAF